MLNSVDRVPRLGLEDLSRGCGVSDRCGLVESEQDGQVERVGAVGERFVELTVDA
ncbi:hypothetical protein [Rhodococcus opacus]|uniref:hypothetical protein n=1 Tax=Rhodococcus opacus TaxID=37919 RepID=UPI0034D34383